MNLIGITGKAGTGKDTLADYFVKQYKFMRYGFADPIKDMLNERFGWRPEDWEDRKWKEQVVEYCGAATYGQGTNFSPRSWAQWLGTEVGRRIDPDCWAKMFERYRADLMSEDTFDQIKFVISDVRFNNEAAMIRKLGGSIVQLTRTGLNEVAAHSSENGIAPDFVNIHYANNGTILQLHDFADFLLR